MSFAISSLKNNCFQTLFFFKTRLDEKSVSAYIAGVMKRLLLFLFCLCWVAAAYAGQIATTRAYGEAPVPIALDDDECGDDDTPPDGGE